MSSAETKNLSWGRVKVILQSCVLPTRHPVPILGLSGQGVHFGKGSRVSQTGEAGDEQAGRSWGWGWAALPAMLGPAEPPAQAGLEGASLPPPHVHACVRACTHMSGHVFVHACVHNPSITTSPLSSLRSSSPRSHVEPAGEQRDPWRAPCTPSWLHPHFPQPLASSSSAHQHPRSKRQGFVPPLRIPLGPAGGFQVPDGSRSGGAGSPVVGRLGSARLGCRVSPPDLLLASSPLRGEGERRVEPAILPDPGAVTLSHRETEPICTGQGQQGSGGQPEPGGHGELVRATRVGLSTRCGKGSWREPGAGQGWEGAAKEG